MLDALIPTKEKCRMMTHEYFKMMSRKPNDDIWSNNYLQIQKNGRDVSLRISEADKVLVFQILLSLNGTSCTLFAIVYSYEVREEIKRSW